MYLGRLTHQLSSYLLKLCLFFSSLLIFNRLLFKLLLFVKLFSWVLRFYVPICVCYSVSLFLFKLDLAQTRLVIKATSLILIFFADFQLVKARFYLLLKLNDFFFELEPLLMELISFSYFSSIMSLQKLVSFFLSMSMELMLRLYLVLFTST